MPYPDTYDPRGKRGTGRTTNALKNAPRYAFYMAPNHGVIRYFLRLTEDLNRSDISIIGPTLAYTWKGTKRPVVVDHAAFDFISWSLGIEIMIHNDLLTRPAPDVKILPDTEAET